ncbi:thiamine pyrophosphate-dependent enzyme, partial [Paenibacillus sp. IHBB 10380]
KSQLTEDLVKHFYRQMVLMRTFDRKAINMQRQGRLGTYAPFEGQEAAQVGSAYALRQDDWIFPTYRDHAATMTFGMPMDTV